jgi:hypothetical protein
VAALSPGQQAVIMLGRESGWPYQFRLLSVRLHAKHPCLGCVSILVTKLGEMAAKKVGRT